MSTFDPNFNLEYDWAFRESGWKDGMDNNLLKIGSLIHLSVISRTDDTPSSPSEGDRYIVPGDATGDWSNEDGNIALYIGSEWKFYEPSIGWWCFIEDSDVMSVYKSSGWSSGIAV